MTTHRRRGLSAFVLVLVVGAAAALGAVRTGSSDVDPAPALGFMTIGVYVDSGAAPLAAWQADIRAVAGDARLVGVEGGAPGVYAEPPHHDPAALRGDRIVVAAYSTAPPDALPRGETKVAVLHFAVSGPIEPRFEAVLAAAAGADGRAIAATVRLLNPEGHP